MTRSTNIFQFLIIFVSSPFILSQDYHVIDFGATGNGIVNDTGAVRAALAAATKTNGGRVIFDGNYTFLTGCFNVSSNIILDIRGKILASNLTSDYVPVQPLPWYGGGPDAQLSGQMEWQSVIRSYQADNITITGGGVIDGQGQYWWPCQLNLTQPPCSGLSRPPLIRLVDTTNININNIVLQNSPSWNLHLANTTNAHINNISILAPLTRRIEDGWFLAIDTDGFDIDCSQNVLVENSYYSGADDAVAIKSGMNYLGRTFGRTTENITLRNLTIGPGACGLSIGSEMSAGVKNVTFKDIKINGCLTGIHLKSERGRGGTIEDITYSNIHMQNMSDDSVAIFLGLNWRPANVTNATATPTMKNIFINNLVSEFPGINSTGWILDGLNESHIQNAQFSNINIATTNTTILVDQCDYIEGTCDSSTVFPSCPPCLKILKSSALSKMVFEKYTLILLLLVIFCCKKW